MGTYLDSFWWDHLVGLTEAPDELLEVGIHELEDQIEDRLPFFVLALFQIQQPIHVKRPISTQIRSGEKYGGYLRVKGKEPERKSLSICLLGNITQEKKKIRQKLQKHKKEGCH